ncbi:MAG: type II secretion system protein [Verrucomicrobiota bacterium]
MKFLRPSRRTQAFTLVEILTVITIISILAAIGFGGFRVAINKSNGRNTLARITALQSNLQGYKNDAGEFPEPLDKDSTINVKNQAYRSGGAEMLYQVMSGDGNSAIKGGTDPSTGIAGSVGKVYWEEVVAPTSKEIENKKTKPMVGVSEDEAYYMIDGWRKPFQYVKAIKDRNKRISNVDEMHSDGEYEIWSYGALDKPLEDEESQREWISSWGSN